MKKPFWLIVFIALLVPSAFSQSSTRRPFQFNFGQIPFGKDSSTVLALVKGLHSTRFPPNFSNPRLPFEGRQTMWGFPFSKGNSGRNAPLLDQRFSVMNNSNNGNGGLDFRIIRGWNISYGGTRTGQTRLVNAYFLKQGAGANHLFIVTKVLVSYSTAGVDDKFYALFEALTKRITESLGQKTLEQFTLANDLYGRPAGGTAEWDAKGVTVILYQPVGGFQMSGPIIFYIDDVLWNDYLRYNATYLKAIQKQQKQSASKSVEGSF